MLKKSLHLTYRVALWLLVILATLLVSAILVLHFWVLPRIDNYRGDIERFASRIAQHKVHIGHIEAGWNGINPELFLSDVVLFDDQSREALVLKNSVVVLSWLSIPLLEPHLANLTLYHPSLTIRRASNGDVFVAGILLQKNKKSTLGNWLLRQSSIALHQANLEWIDEQRPAPPLKLSQLEFLLERLAWKSLLEQHYFYLQTRASAVTASPILLTGAFYGDDLDQLPHWQGEVNLELRSADLSAVQPWWDKPATVGNLLGDVKLKAQFSKLALRTLSGELNVSKLSLPNWNGDLGLQGGFSWKPLPASGYLLNFDNMKISNAQGVMAEGLNGRYVENSPQQINLNLQLERLDVAFLAAYQGPELKNYATLQPSGHLNALKLNWQDSAHYKLEFGFEQLTTNSMLALSPRLQMPQMSNFSGRLSLTPNAGSLVLDVQSAQLYAKNLLRWPLAIDRLQGTVRWNVDLDDIHVQAENLSLMTPQLQLALSGSYQQSASGGDRMDMTANFSGDLKQAYFYYPAMLNAATLHWLDTSLLAGNLKNGTVTIQGKLSDFPFVGKNNGVFRVSADLDAGLIEYGSGWPMLEKVRAKLLFEGYTMTVTVASGQTLGNQLSNSIATIPNLTVDEPVLNVTSELKGNVADVLKFVNNSPIRKTTQGLTQDLVASGQGRLALKLNIPMQHLENSSYQGVYQVTEAGLSGRSIPNLTRINGALHVSEKGISANNVQLLAWNTPMNLNLTSAKNNTLLMRVAGSSTDELLKQTLGDYRKFFTGSAGWNADIWLNKSAVHFNVRSDLVGMRLNLPAPLAKSSNEALELQVSKREDSGNETWLVSLGQRLSAKLLVNNTANPAQVERGVLYLGKTTADNAPLGFKGLAVYGNLDYWDVDAWRASIGALASSSPSLPYKFDLAINTLEIFSRRLNNLRLRGMSVSDGATVNLESADLSGQIEWLTQHKGKLVANFSNLTIPESVASLKNVSEVDNVPTKYPDVEVTANNFVWEGRRLGALNLSAYHQNNDWVIKDFKLTQPDSTLQVSGKWSHQIQRPSTFLNVQWTVNDLGLALGHLRYDNLIKGGKGSLSGKLTFPGDPLSFSLTKLEGDVQFDMRKGTVLKVQPGVGRLLGVLSLQNLPRRLTLDFRDLFSSGFAFDKVAANVKISSGVMSSDNLVLSGPAADVNIKGEANLQKETQRLQVKILPRVSDSLSLAALAGGPLVGAVAFLTQKILQDPLNKIASSNYIITGTWDNPQEEKPPIADTPINPINH